MFLSKIVPEQSTSFERINSEYLNLFCCFAYGTKSVCQKPISPKTTKMLSNHVVTKTFISEHYMGNKIA